MQVRLTRLICGILFLIGLPSLHAATIFVDSRAVSSGDGSSWATAYKHLQDALTAARDSGGTITEIWVASGTYQPDRSDANAAGSRDRAATFSLVNGVALRGGFAGNEDPTAFNLSDRDFETNETVLSGDLAGDDGADFTNNAENSYGVVTANGVGSATIIDGFAVQAGSLGASSVHRGAGMLVVSSSPLVGNCTFKNNDCGNYWGGGLSNNNGSPVLVNCLFAGNRAGYGGGFYSTGTGKPTLMNCTFMQNTGCGLYSSSPLSATNCVLWGNRSQQLRLPTSGSITYSCIQGGWAGAGNISTDPKLMGNGRLRRGSSCIDAGDNTAVAESIESDRAGHARFIDDPETPDTGNLGPSAKPPVDMGAFEYASVPAERLYVNGNALANGNGSSWTSPLPYLQDAFKAADTRPGVTEIWVASGTHKPDRDAAHTAGTGDRLATFDLPGGVKVYGGFPGKPGQEDNLAVRNPWSYPTVLSGDLAGNDGLSFAGIAENSVHVMRAWGVGESTLLDGFAVTGGNADAYGWTDGSGMLVMASTLTVANSVLRDNSATRKGGGIAAIESTVTVAQCKFLNNRGQGSGMRATACPSVTLINCLFLGNSITAYDTDSDTTIVNCTFTGNTGTGIPTAIFCSGKLFMTNSIVWGQGGPGMTVSGGATFRYSCLQDGFTGEGVNNFEPHLLPDGRLSPLSYPCLDHGDNASVPAGITTDVDGRERFVNPSSAYPGSGNLGTPVVDMGAFEAPAEMRHVYVRPEANSDGDGLSWQTAYAHLQDALVDAAAPSELISAVCISQGVCRPDRNSANPTGSGDRNAVFDIPEAVFLFGGFPGVPGQEGDWSVRNPRAHETVLSGDLQGNDAPGFMNNSENSYHVLTGVANRTAVDGLTISGGNANGPPPHDQGGGVYSALAVMRNCVIRGNAALSRGGGVYGWYTGPLFNCVFIENAVGSMGTGGGLYVQADTTLVNCTFVLNSARDGGALCLVSSPRVPVTNCIFWQNTSTNSCPNISGNPTVNYSCVQGGYSGTGNISSDPLLVNLATGDLRLQAGSPCIDAGKNSAVPSWVANDILGLPRFFDHAGVSDCRWAPGTCGSAPIVDMGAHEFVIMPGDFDDDYDVDAADFDAFEQCAAGPAVALMGDCGPADLDSDLDADVVDFGAFQRCISGAGRLGNVNCVD